jgi:hypothetical protein
MSCDEIIKQIETDLEKIKEWRELAEMCLCQFDIQLQNIPTLTPIQNSRKKQKNKGIRKVLLVTRLFPHVKSTTKPT